MGRFLDILGAFADGYIEERGVDGTLDDVAGVVNKIGGWFQSDGGGSAKEDKMYDEANSCIERGDYRGALDVLRKSDKYNAMYYYNKCLVLMRWYKNTKSGEDEEIKSELLENIKMAKMRCTEKDDEEVLIAIGKMEDELMYVDTQCKLWDSLLKKYHDGVQEGNYSKLIDAKNLLEEHFKNNKAWDEKESEEVDAAYYHSFKLDIDVSLLTKTTLTDVQQVALVVECEELILELKSEDTEHSYTPSIINAENVLPFIKERLGDKMNVLKGVVDLTDEEQKYLEEVKFCFEDDHSISDSDRKYLERKRVKLGVSEERARIIEDTVVSGDGALTADEKEYVEIFKDFVSDGEITNRARRVLDRERESLGISVERAAELEKMSLASEI